MLHEHRLKRFTCGLGKLSIIAALPFIFASLFFPRVVPAQTTFSPFSNFTISGYGTLGYAWLDDKNAEYRTGEGKSGANNEGSFEVDSRIALQLDGTFSSRLSGSLQAIARQDESGDLGAQLEWGFLRFLPSERIELRVGRMSLPVFSISDFREVGYANVLLRPPEDVYSQVPIRRFNGADITVESLVLGSLITVQLIGGTAREKVSNGLEPDIKQLLGLSTWIERGPIKARVNITGAEIDINSRSESIKRLLQGIDLTLTLVPELGNKLDPVKADLTSEPAALIFTSFGLSADFDSYFVDFEYASRRIDNWVGNVDSWSVVAGFSIGRFDPYVFVSSNKNLPSGQRVTLPDSPELSALELGINRLYAPGSQSTTGAGIRFDLTEKIALKSQLEFISRDNIGISFSRLSDDGSDSGKDVMLFSSVIDFVF